MEWIKVIHIVAVISWMAGMLYLPRIFVYHVNAKPDVKDQFIIMEKRLLKFIMNPAMLVTWITGFMMAIHFSYFQNGWMHGKLLFVILMTVTHMLMGKYRKSLETEKNNKSEKFFRVFNEVPTILMIIIVILVVVKPF